MDTDDLIYCRKCGVCHNIYNIEKKENDKYSRGFNWICSVCKFENYEN